MTNPLPAIFRPIKIKTTLVYAWLTTNNPPQIPNFVFALTTRPQPIRQSKRLSPMGHFVKVTAAQCHPIGEFGSESALPFIYELTDELLTHSYPMFDQQGEPLFQVTAANSTAPDPNEAALLQSRTTPRPIIDPTPLVPGFEDWDNIPNHLSPPTNHLHNHPDLLTEPPHPVFLLTIMHNVNRRIKAAESNRKRVARHRSNESEYLASPPQEIS